MIGLLRVTPQTDIAAIVGRSLTESHVPGVVAAYLFGSVGEERAHRESDVDIGVLLDWRVHPTARQRFDVRVRLAAVLAGRLRRDADVVILNDAPPQLGRAIVTKGRRIYCTDEERTHAFVRDVQLRAADVAPFLQRTRARKLAALAR